LSRQIEGGPLSSRKTDIIERLFLKRWDSTTTSLSNPIVTLEDVSEAIREHNAANPAARLMSDRNPANFFKDFIRVKERANANWPKSILDRGYTARQVTGGNLCFEFVPLAPGQSVPFPFNTVPPPTEHTPRHRIESASLPLASRRLGRRDESWLVQVLIRLRVIETHLALFSTRTFVQIDHLQMSVKLTISEIDALFLGIEQLKSGSTREVLISCEAKGLRDDILEDQVLRQVQAIFSMRDVAQDTVIPMRGALNIRLVSSSDAHPRTGAASSGPGDADS
jgi:hypothetical protein